MRNSSYAQRWMMGTMEWGMIRSTTFKLRRRLSISKPMALTHPFPFRWSTATSIPMNRTTNSGSKRPFATGMGKTPSTPSRGLFALPELQNPSDFARTAQAAIDQCERIRQEIPTIDPIRNTDYLLFQVDAISRILCNYTDAAELARSAHACPHWRDAAQRAFAILSDYMSQLNCDPSLYHALRRVSDGKVELTEEQARLCLLLQQDFERDGIHLPDAERDRVRSLQNQITGLESIFSRNIASSQEEFWADAAEVEEIIPRKVLNSYGIGQTSHEEGSDKANKIRLGKTDNPILQTLIKYSASPGLRRQVYIESTTAVAENLSVLRALIGARHELARTVGFPSYADRFLRDKMAGDPRTVLDFLHGLLARVQPLYRREMEQLAAAKENIEGISRLEPWDVAYYSALIQSGDGFDSHYVTEYLSLSNCLACMRLLVADIFGIKMIEEPMSPGEGWDVTDDDQTSQIRRFVFHDSDDRPLGTMYLDLAPRDNKYVHAAHFTVRCGCRTTFRDRVRNKGDTIAAASGDIDDDFQLPIVALLCNFPAGKMPHSEVETLFHEFGHGLHSLLSRTQFQHMSGTRGQIDFVETPSHLLEHFCWDTETLQNGVFAVNDGVVIPDDLVLKLQKSRQSFSGIERQTQILYSLFDQALFSGITIEDEHHSTRIFAELHRKLEMPYVEGTHWHSKFGHLVTYGCGYYGYLWAQVFADDLWRTLFHYKSPSARRSSGELLWHGILQHGGARDPKVMLTEVLGRPPSLYTFAQRGDGS